MTHARHLAISALIVSAVALPISFIAWHKPAQANAAAQSATGYQCASCHVDVSRNVTRQGLTPFGKQWQDNKCPTKTGNLCDNRPRQ